MNKDSKNNVDYTLSFLVPRYSDLERIWGYLDLLI